MSRKISYAQVGTRFIVGAMESHIPSEPSIRAPMHTEKGLARTPEVSTPRLGLLPLTDTLTTRSSCEKNIPLWEIYGQVSIKFIIANRYSVIPSGVNKNDASSGPQCTLKIRKSTNAHTKGTNNSLGFNA